MKLLCVQRDPRGRLRVGEVYTAAGDDSCHCGRRWYFISEFPSESPATKLWQCHNCLEISVRPPASYHYHPFLQYRFIPWRPDELKVTEQEVKQLYSLELLPHEAVALYERWRNIFPEVAAAWLSRRLTTRGR